MNKMLSTLIIAAACALPGTAVQAAVVTFDTSTDFAFNNGESNLIEGFKFTLDSGRPNSFYFAGLDVSPSIVNNGSKNLFAGNQANLLVESALGLSFNLLSFDLGGSFVDPTQMDAWAQSLTLIGHTATGDLMTTVNLPASATLSTITLNWQGVQSLEFRPNGVPNGGDFGPDFVIDNLAVNVIPEPASWALVLLALAGAVRPAIRRRCADCAGPAGTVW